MFTGEQLRERRIALGLSQKKLAELIGYKSNGGEVMIRRIEHNQRRIPPEKYRLLAEALRIDVVELIP